jgi:hypothetical protein
MRVLLAGLHCTATDLSNICVYDLLQYEGATPYLPPSSEPELHLKIILSYLQGDVPEYVLAVPVTSPHSWATSYRIDVSYSQPAILLRFCNNLGHKSHFFESQFSEQSKGKTSYSAFGTQARAVKISLLLP